MNRSGALQTATILKHRQKSEQKLKALQHMVGVDDLIDEICCNSSKVAEVLFQQKESSTRNHVTYEISRKVSQDVASQKLS